MNIMAKHDGHAIVASFDSQYRHCGESEEIAAPQFGQFRVCASIDSGAHASCPREMRASYIITSTVLIATKQFNAGRDAYAPHAGMRALR
jgi:hypothetical protein